MATKPVPVQASDICDEDLYDAAYILWRNEFGQDPINGGPAPSPSASEYEWALACERFAGQGDLPYMTDLFENIADNLRSVTK